MAEACRGEGRGLSGSRPKREWRKRERPEVGLRERARRGRARRCASKGLYARAWSAGRSCWALQRMSAPPSSRSPRRHSCAACNTPRQLPRSVHARQVPCGAGGSSEYSSTHFRPPLACEYCSTPFQVSTGPRSVHARQVPCGARLREPARCRRIQASKPGPAPRKPLGESPARRASEGCGPEMGGRWRGTAAG